MICSNCEKEVPSNRIMCPACFHLLQAVPVPPGGTIRFGGYTWYVLDKRDGRALLLTENVIEKRGYHGQEAEITWETSDLRQYLNGAFYRSFSEADRERICEVTNDNDDNPWYGTRGGRPTVDRIFLLSIAEVVRYFGDSGQLKTKNRNPGCDWLKDAFFWFVSDQYNLARHAVDGTGRVATWWLRSPGGSERFAANVFGDIDDGMDHGEIAVDGDIGFDIGDGGILIDGHMCYDGPGYLTHAKGVRPALWLRMA